MRMAVTAAVPVTVAALIGGAAVAADQPLDAAAAERAIDACVDAVEFRPGGWVIMPPLSGDVRSTPTSFVDSPIGERNGQLIYGIRGKSGCVYECQRDTSRVSDTVMNCIKREAQ